MEKEKRSLVKTLGWGVICGIAFGISYIIFH
ncbi:prophage protein [Lactococcus lactis subsp. lactis]|uniref:Prophage protein n=1 Tax=Lactococcus lactis subsp. lactis TaxID=1360 RepID=A0A1V0NDW7_LACLL|nr:prophage protein [Lactococcus lactis subsp. lactis]